MLKLTIGILSTLFLAACSQTLDLNRPAPPHERLVCAALPAAPDISPLEAVTASNGALVYMKADVDARDTGIARYIVAVRGAWFDCSSNLEWVRDYYAAD